MIFCVHPGLYRRGEHMTIAQPIAARRQATLTPAKSTGYTRRRLWTGRVLTGLSSAFFIFDACMKIVKIPAVVEASMRLGYPESAIVGTGVALLACTLLYLIPRTSILVAV